MITKSFTGRTTNTKRNIVFGFLQVVVSQVLPFIVRTILIYRFGVEYLGLNSLFTSILSVLSLMELGFGTAVVYSLYKPVADSDKDLICAYLAYYRRVYRIIGVVILSAGLLLMPFLHSLIKDASLPDGLNLYICYLIFLCDTVISYLLFGYMTSIPTAYQRRDILSKIDLVLYLLQCIFKVTMLLVSKNFYLYLVSIPILTVVRNLVVARTIRKTYPDLKCLGELSTDRKRDLNPKIRGLLIGKITGASRNSIDTICISAFIGLTVTGMYNNYYFVMTAIVSFSVIVLNSMMASVGNSIATETRDKNYADFRLFDFIYMAIAGWAAVSMLCLFQPFIKTWLGNEMMFDIPIVLGFCAYFYILKSGDIRWVYHEGAGLWYESRFIMIGEAIANILLNILFCRLWGVLGIILATVVSVFVTNFVFCPRLLFKLYFKNGKLKEYWLDHFFYATTMLLSAGIGWFLCERILSIEMIGTGIMNSILCLGGRLIICTALSVCVFWLIWHRSERYKTAVVWMKKMIKA